jgi:hypothetical protein
LHREKTNVDPLDPRLTLDAPFEKACPTFVPPLLAYQARTWHPAEHTTQLSVRIATPDVELPDSESDMNVVGEAA